MSFTPIPNKPINIFLYGKVIQQKVKNEFNTSTGQGKSYIKYQGKEIIVNYEDFYIVDGEKIYRPQNIEYNHKLNDLYSFAKYELETYYYCGNMAFKEKASKYYLTYLERKGKKRIEVIDEYIKDREEIKDVLKDVLKDYKEEKAEFKLIKYIMQIRKISLNASYSFEYLKQIFNVLRKEC